MKDKRLRKIRALKIINAWCSPGMRMKEMESQFKLCEATIRREVNFAEREGLLKTIQDSLANDLIPKALALYVKHLELQMEEASKKGAKPPDLEAAKDILKGTRIFSGGGGNSSALEAQVESEQTLEGYIVRRKELDESKPKGSSGRILRSKNEDPEECINGEILRRDDNQRSENQGSRDSSSESSGGLLEAED